MPYFSGQGRVYIAERNSAGDADVFRFVGNSPQFDLSFETDVLSHNESSTGQRVTDLRLLRGKEASLTLVLEEFESKNLALALFGEDAVITGASVTDEVLAGGSTNVVAGDYVSAKNAKLSAIVVKDSDASPATLTEGTDYRVQSAEHGTLEFIDVGSYVQPFTIDYTYADAINVKMLSQGLTERWIRLDGLNTADNNAPVVVEIYRAAFDPAETLAFITDELFQMSLNGSALSDETKEGDALLGRFGRMII